MKLSVVVPTYNRVDLLEKCLDSFSNQTFPKNEFEVIVVDDGSSDGTRAILESKEYPFLLKKIYQNHAGAAAARNKGIEDSTGEIIVFTDDDCFPEVSFLEAHWKAHQEKDDLIVRGPILIIRDFEEYGKIRAKSSDFSNNFFCTSNASLKRGAFDKSGKFDETFGRWEDAELGFRLRKLGLKNHFTFDAIVYHLKPTWKIESLVRVALADGRGAAKLFRVHPSLRTWLSGGLHPFSILSGLFFQPLARLKVSSMKPDAAISGLWERLIFHAYFVQGIRE